MPAKPMTAKPMNANVRIAIYAAGADVRVKMFYNDDAAAGFKL